MNARKNKDASSSKDSNTIYSKDASLSKDVHRNRTPQLYCCGRNALGSKDNSNSRDSIPTAGTPATAGTPPTAGTPSVAAAGRQQHQGRQDCKDISCSKVMAFLVLQTFMFISNNICGFANV
jgi:hypothetical protein